MQGQQQMQQQMMVQQQMMQGQQQMQQQMMVQQQISQLSAQAFASNPSAAGRKAALKKLHKASRLAHQAGDANQQMAIAVHGLHLGDNEYLASPRDNFYSISARAATAISKAEASLSEPLGLGCSHSVPPPLPSNSSTAMVHIASDQRRFDWSPNHCHRWPWPGNESSALRREHNYCYCPPQPTMMIWHQQHVMLRR